MRELISALLLLHSKESRQSQVVTFSGDQAFCGVRSETREKIRIVFNHRLDRYGVYGFLHTTGDDCDHLADNDQTPKGSTRRAYEVLRGSCGIFVHNTAERREGG